METQVKRCRGVHRTHFFGEFGLTSPALRGGEFGLTPSGPGLENLVNPLPGWRIWSTPSGVENLVYPPLGVKNLHSM